MKPEKTFTIKQLKKEEKDWIDKKGWLSLKDKYPSGSEFIPFLEYLKKKYKN